jgi:lipoic acid synthetase
LVVERRIPSWLTVKIPGGRGFREIRDMLRTAELHTVCEEAHCPNIGECWERKSATFMILGDICTRACRYCAVISGKPTGLDLEEPKRLARTVNHLGLMYCVITSVNRDDLPDGGASIFSACIREIHSVRPECEVEVLIPDFQGKTVPLHSVLDAGPAVLNHNIETVPRIFPKVRAKGDYTLSINLLKESSFYAPNIPTKSGLMVGLGESHEEILGTMSDLSNAGCELLTIGQYLRPSPQHIEMDRFYHPSEFKELERAGYQMGFKHVASGPLVRSSYHADEGHNTVKHYRR